MDDHRRPTSWPDRICEAITLSLTCLAPWAFGSVEAWAELVIGIGIVLLAGFSMIAGWRSDRPTHSLRMPGFAIAGLAALAMAQSTALPDPMLGWIAPAAVEARSGLAPSTPVRIVGDGGPAVPPPAWTISVDPELTLCHAARLAGGWVLFQAVIGLGGGPAALRRLGLALAGNATLLALFAFAQALTWDGKIFWLRPAPIQSGWDTGGPFVGHGPLAAYLNLGLGFAISFLVIPGAGRRFRPWAGYASVVISVGIVASHSRIGFLAMLAAGVALIALSTAGRGPLWNREGSAERRSASSNESISDSAGRQPIRNRQGGSATARGPGWFARRCLIRYRLGSSAGLLALLAVACIVPRLLGESTSWARLSSITDASALSPRLEIWRASLLAWRERPVWGSGLGCFATAAAPHLRLDTGFFCTRAEDEYLDLLVEAGIAGLGLAVLGLTATARLGWGALKGVTSSTGCATILGALFGLVALGVHSLADFALHLPGVAVPALILTARLCGLGLNAAARLPDPSSPPRPWVRKGRRFAVGSAMLLASLWAAARGLELARSEATLAGSDVPLPGAAMPDLNDDNPEALLQHRAKALERALARRPRWTEGHLRLGVTQLNLYRRRAETWLTAAPGGVSNAGKLADPLWIHGVVHAGLAGRLTDLEPVRVHLIPAARCFLEARRCSPALATAHGGLAVLDYLLEPVEPASLHAARALRLAGPDGALLVKVGTSAAQAGEVSLAARCWRRSLEVRAAGWPEVADAALAVLPPDVILKDVLPPEGRFAAWFAGRLNLGPGHREARDEFLRAALDRLPCDRGLAEPDRRRLEARCWAGLGEYARARSCMEEALGLAPEQFEWRREMVEWSLGWGDFEAARHQALIALQLRPGDAQFSRVLDSAAEGLARGADDPQPRESSPQPDRLQSGERRGEGSPATGQQGSDRP